MLTSSGGVGSADCVVSFPADSSASARAQCSQRGWCVENAVPAANTAWQRLQTQVLADMGLFCRSLQLPARKKQQHVRTLRGSAPHRAGCDRKSRARKPSKALVRVGGMDYSGTFSFTSGAEAEGNGLHKRVGLGYEAGAASGGSCADRDTKTQHRQNRKPHGHLNWGIRQSSRLRTGTRRFQPSSRPEESPSRSVGHLPMTFSFGKACFSFATPASLTLVPSR